MIIDPTNDNNAINQRGELVHAFRLIKLAAPGRPTRDELAASGPIVGYGNPLAIVSSEGRRVIIDAWGDEIGEVQ